MVRYLAAVVAIAISQGITAFVPPSARSVRERSALMAAAKRSGGGGSSDGRPFWKEVGGGKKKRGQGKRKRER